MYKYLPVTSFYVPASSWSRVRPPSSAHLTATPLAIRDKQLGLLMTRFVINKLIYWSAIDRVDWFRPQSIDSIDW